MIQGGFLSLQPRSEMPKLKDVPSLYSLAIDVLEDEFVQFVKEELCLQSDEDQLFCIYSPEIFSSYVEMVKSLVLTNVPVVARQDLLDHILKKMDMSSTVRYAAVEILYESDCKRFIPGTFPQSYHPMILSKVISECQSLKFIDLTYFWVRGTDKRYLSQLFSNARNLTSIVIPQICDDALLSVIGKCCSNVSFLDIQNSVNVTETGIDNLIFSDNGSVNSICMSLVVFKIGGPRLTAISPSKMTFLLKFAPFLSNLGPYAYCGRLLGIMNEDLKHQPTNLYYVHDTYTTDNQMIAIEKMAPQLKGVYFDTPSDEAVSHLSLFKGLMKLKIRKAFWIDIFVPALQMENLQILELINIHGNIDLAHIGKFWHLQKLVIYHCDRLVSSDFTYHFKNLNFLEIYYTEYFDNVLLHILTHSQNLEHLSLGYFGTISDEELIPILSFDKLINLEKLWIARAEFLSWMSVAAILDYCPKLKSIGRMENWNLTKGELEKFGEMARFSNWDLLFWEFFS
ncbi:uncharacterized protein LOC136040836 isoform X2 [Artemia franciscana]|uniref:Uncharacterized protein n=1 Tax=Artemia franciscana TaxID=6661 RepID=A0AA88HNZ4_ARTSF|nr:hypothetical protein QYM36_009630 [Artemia franciscana]